MPIGGGPEPFCVVLHDTSDRASNRALGLTQFINFTPLNSEPSHRRCQCLRLHPIQRPLSIRCLPALYHKRLQADLDKTERNRRSTITHIAAQRYFLFAVADADRSPPASRKRSVQKTMCHLRQAQEHRPILQIQRRTHRRQMKYRAAAPTHNRRYLLRRDVHA